jgi:hypothetical protein
MAYSTSSARRVPKATYVPFKFTPNPDLVGGAIVKYGYVAQLALQPGEVAAARKQAGVSKSTAQDEALWKSLAQLEGNSLLSQRPAFSSFAKTTHADLLAIGKAITLLRQQQNDISSTAKPNAPQAELGTTQPHSTIDLTTAASLVRLNNALVATSAFSQTSERTPIGWLNLERLEMIPVGIVRGQLLATVCLAPMEKTVITEKEWSVITQEFSSIVTDSLVNYSETGVAENTELAKSTTSQTQHSNQFNINATVSGSNGFVTATVASGFASQDQTSDSATASTKHAIDTTKKASSRVKQSHRISISSTTVSGTSASSSRTLRNTSKTDPMRIDYFSLMRKWHVGLYGTGCG